MDDAAAGVSTPRAEPPAGAGDAGQRFSLVPMPFRGRRWSTLGTKPLPSSLVRLAWRLGQADQIYLCILAGAVALLDTVPIEIQRRLINHGIKESGLRSITLLALAYAAVVLVQGLTKLLSNAYRGWTAEHAVRVLRGYIDRRLHDADAPEATPEDQGTQVSLIVAESEPIGAFMGECVSEPVLQGGIMVAVVGYLVWLQPVIALVFVAVYLPQMVFVPLIQRAINRRAQARIATLREASAGVLDHAAADGMDDQEARFDRVFHLNLGVIKLKYTMNFLMNLCHQFGIAAILGIGGWFVVLGRIEVGTVVAFISGLATVKDPWDDLATWFQTMMVTSARYDLMRRTLAGDPPIAAADLIEADAA